MIVAHGQLITSPQTVACDRILCRQQKGRGTITDVGMGLDCTALYCRPGLLCFHTKLYYYIYLRNHLDVIVELFGFIGFSQAKASPTGHTLRAVMQKVAL